MIKVYSLIEGYWDLSVPPKTSTVTTSCDYDCCFKSTRVQARTLYHRDHDRNDYYLHSCLTILASPHLVVVKGHELEYKHSSRLIRNMAQGVAV